MDEPTSPESDESAGGAQFVSLILCMLTTC